MTKVTYSPQARTDLREIGGYIALDSERNADAFIARVVRKAEQASRTPLIYKRRDDLSPGLRSAAVGRYLVLFRVAENGIDVSRVVHGARDLKILFES